MLLLSGIQNISQSLYEAAELDGASKIRQFFSITLPMVSPTLFVVLIMQPVGFPEGLRSDLLKGGADEPCADQRTRA